MVEWGRSESLGRLAVYIGAAPVASPTCNAGYEHTQTVETLVPAERRGTRKLFCHLGALPRSLAAGSAKRPEVRFREVQCYPARLT